MYNPPSRQFFDKLSPGDVVHLEDTGEDGTMTPAQGVFKDTLVVANEVVITIEGDDFYFSREDGYTRLGRFRIIETPTKDPTP